MLGQHTRTYTIHIFGALKYTWMGIFLVHFITGFVQPMKGQGMLMFVYSQEK